MCSDSARDVRGEGGIVICYGDSNTFGYDPVSGGTGRYPESVRWTDIVQRESGLTVRNHGVCGREIPHYGSQVQFAKSQFEDWGREAVPVSVWIMLGTNDLLMNPRFGATDAAARMEKFLETVTALPSAVSGAVKLHLIAPPPVRPGAWIESGETVIESMKLGAAYSKVAAKLGIGFTDAGKWDIPVVYDGVHFSAEGHRRFADGVEKEMLSLHYVRREAKI